ncbi:AraC family transcriptional regulator [Paludisphaera rhizosphaerae]|uniref:AraC family transcriptional regulator n=1 Tax=Paludisphaera rhizosphaerae TaxID=2711216 RepID=UPI0013ED28F9|nr:helix-turn-helix domain-containing protein [Paludisphaera rhizosphaerae]
MRFQEFDDFEAYAAAVRHADVYMMCDRLEIPQWQLTNWDFTGISLQLGREGGGNLCEGARRLGGRILYLPLTRVEFSSVNGERLDDESLVVIDPGSEFCITGRRRAHDWTSIFIPWAAEHPSPSAQTLGVAGCRVVRPGSDPRRRLVDLISCIASMSPSPDVLPEPARRAASLELLEAALACIATEESPTPPEIGRPRLRRHEIIRRCLEFIEDQGPGPIRVAALADAASVSDRTVRAAFHDYFGLSPIKYLQMRMLHRVRQTLRRASADSTTVTKVLADHGIWEFGRFACRYREQFGESPSETLRRPPH